MINQFFNYFSYSEEGVLPRKKIRIRWYNDVYFLIGKFFSLVSTSLKTTDKLDTNSYSFFFINI